MTAACTSASAGDYLARLQAVYPGLNPISVRLHTTGGQFNDLLFVTDASQPDSPLIFRFPRTSAAEETLRNEVAVLAYLNGRLSLPVPQVRYLSLEPGQAGSVFMGYPQIPGEPLFRQRLAEIQPEAALDRLAHQLGAFLIELHSLPLAELNLPFPRPYGKPHWTDLLAQFRRELYPWMRPDACRAVDDHFAAFLADPASFQYEPVLCHGDFGGSNILYDSGSVSISGVIDFGFSGPGDPAQDLAAISTYGEDFFDRLLQTYPAAEADLARASFYRSTFALQQALYALQTGDQESLEDGLSGYV
jgi:aminoglycoside 2''-phosphotransferase